MEAGNELASLITRTKLICIPAAVSFPILFLGALALTLAGVFLLRAKAYVAAFDQT